MTEIATELGTGVPSVSDIDLTHAFVPFGFAQGPRPLCLPFAVSAAHQITRGLTEAYSPEALWNTCVRNNTTADAGTSLSAVSDAVLAVGQPELRTWPYNPTLGAGTEIVPAAAAAAPWHTGAMGLLDVSGGLEPAIERALAAAQPVVLVIEVSDEFTFVAGDAIVTVPESIPEFQGLHAVLLVGTEMRQGQGRVYRVLNSWGSDWADGGFTWLPVDYIERYGYQAALLAVQGLHTPAS